MLGGKLRLKMKGLFAGAAKPLAVLPLTPNQFTFLSVPMAAIAAAFLYCHNFALALVFIFLAILVDVLDGSFAAAKGRKTNFGNYFDAVVDKIVECAFYVGFAFVSPVPAILALAGTMLESYAKPRVGLVVITDNHDWPAVGERSDRLLILIVGTLAAALFPERQLFLISATLGIVFAITMAGFVQRVAYARKLVLEAEKKGTLLPYLRAKTKKRQQ